MLLLQRRRRRKCSDILGGKPAELPHFVRNGAPPFSERAPSISESRPTWIGMSAPLPLEWSHEQKRDDGNEMMLIALTGTKILTELGHFGDHSPNQRRLPRCCPTCTGIGAPFHRNTHQLCSGSQQRPFLLLRLWSWRRRDSLRGTLPPSEVLASVGGAASMACCRALIAGSRTFLSRSVTPPRRGDCLSVPTWYPFPAAGRAHAGRLRPRRLPPKLADAVGPRFAGSPSGRPGHRRWLRHLRAPRRFPAGGQSLWPKPFGLSTSSSVLARRQGRLILMGASPSLSGSDPGRRSVDYAVLWEAGFHNVTCSLGTQLNGRQFQQLCEGPRTVYLAFDADANGSGRQAAQCLAGRLRERGITARLVSLPANHDPNSFFVAGGDAQSFHRLLQEAS